VPCDRSRMPRTQEARSSPGRLQAARASGRVVLVGGDSGAIAPRSQPLAAILGTCQGRHAPALANHSGTREELQEILERDRANECGRRGHRKRGHCCGVGTRRFEPLSTIRCVGGLGCCVRIAKGAASSSTIDSRRGRRARSKAIGRARGHREFIVQFLLKAMDAKSPRNAGEHSHSASENPDEVEVTVQTVNGTSYNDTTPDRPCVWSTKSKGGPRVAQPLDHQTMAGGLGRACHRGAPFACLSVQTRRAPVPVDANRPPEHSCIPT